MARASATTSNFARILHGGSCSNIAASVHIRLDASKRLAECAKQVFLKPYRALVEVLNISERDSHYRLAGTRPFRAEEIAKLLQTEEGINFLAAIMADAQPEWWCLFKVLMEGADINRQRAMAKRRANRLLKRVLNDYADVEAQIERAETLAFLGSDQAGVHAAALREVALPHRGPVARKR